MTLNLSRMSHEELKTRLARIDPNLVFESRKHNVRVYMILEEHTKNNIIPAALGGKSEKSIDQMLREDLHKGRVDFSKMGKTLGPILKETKFKRSS